MIVGIVLTLGLPLLGFVLDSCRSPRRLPRLSPEQATVTQDTPKTPPSVPTTPCPVAEFATPDLDGDGAPDQIAFHCTPGADTSHPWSERLVVRLSANGETEFRSSEGWSAPQEPSLPDPNILGSPMGYLHDFGPGPGHLLFVTEGGSGGYAPGLTIIRLGRDGASLYFSEGECVWRLEHDLPAQTWFLIEQPGLREMFGDPEHPEAPVSTYLPTVVLRLATAPKIDHPRTRLENTYLHGGYAGPYPRHDVLIVEPPGSRPYLRFLNQ